MKQTIYILSAGIKQDDNGNWVSSDLQEDEKFAGAPGGKLRVIAAAYLYKDKRSKIITSGGQGCDKNIENTDHPNVSTILKEELVELGVKEEDIVEENKSGNTYSQLEELKKIINSNNLKRIRIITNTYHLPRVQAMIEHDGELKQMLQYGQIELLSAEEICIEHDSQKWKAIVEKAYESELIKKIIRLEQKGVEDIKNGVYKFK